MIETLETVTLAALLILWFVSIFKYLLFERKAQREGATNPPTLAAKLARMGEGLKQRSRLLAIGLIGFVIANTVFYAFVNLAISKGYVGHNPALEPLQSLAWTLTYTALIAQLIAQLANQRFFSRVLRWFTIIVCLLSYFIFCLWGANALS